MPKFQKRHYEAIASILANDVTERQAPLFIDAGDRRQFAHKLARYFQSDNPRFDRDRFMAACGITNRLADVDAGIYIIGNEVGIIRAPNRR